MAGLPGGTDERAAEEEIRFYERDRDRFPFLSNFFEHSLVIGGRDDWESVKEDLMLRALRAKFSIPELCERLLATDDAKLVEDSGLSHARRLSRVGPSGSELES